LTFFPYAGNNICHRIAGTALPEIVRLGLVTRRTLWEVPERGSDHHRWWLPVKQIMYLTLEIYSFPQSSWWLLKAAETPVGRCLLLPDSLFKVTTSRPSNCCG